MQMGYVLDIACPIRYTTGDVLKMAFDVLHQPCSGFPEVYLCKAVMWEGLLVDMFFRALSWMMI